MTHWIELSFLEHFRQGTGTIGDWMSCQGRNEHFESWGDEFANPDKAFRAGYKKMGGVLDFQNSASETI